MSVLIVIPARMGSKRFFGKPLAKILGVPMIKRVWDIGVKSKTADKVVIATESEELKLFVESFGGEVVMTSNNCETGTDRVYETLNKLEQKFDIVCSLQGDNALLPIEIVDQTIIAAKDTDIATPAVKLTGEKLKRFVSSKQNGSTTGTTVVFDKNKNALYFSKEILPKYRDGNIEEIYQHVGFYAYKSDILKKFATLKPSRLEKIEKLEQLRALENGINIKVVTFDKEINMHSVDNPEDIAIVEDILKGERYEYS